MQLKSGQRSQTTEKVTTNELFVITSQKSDANTEIDTSKTICQIKDKFSGAVVSELPAIKGSKRQSTWQNMKKLVR